ncbi:hypothetical protein BDC45DRAFT_520561 [Circinella umbellata]|nr:hypothetical protein BDC45DRAFT_520561 [Circinella umbellata]
MSRLMLKQEFSPTKVQPQPSATRDDGTTTPTTSRLNRSPLEYDKFDAEAGSILIALANQEPQPLKVEKIKNKYDGNKIDQDGDIVMKNNENNSIKNGVNHMSGKDLSTTKSSSSSMSISSLLGGNSNNNNNRGLSTITPTVHNDKEALTSDSINNRMTKGQEQQSTKREIMEEEQQNTVSDPIMLLAAAAAAIDGRTDESTAAIHSSMDQQETKKNVMNRPGYGYYSHSTERPNHPHIHHSYNNQKQTTTPSTKLSSHPSPTHYKVEGSTESTIKSRYLSSTHSGRNHSHMNRESNNNNDDLRGGQSEGSNVFSYQYMSMKQNPRIKRNAMHAYITYMIYTDMAQRDRMKSNTNNTEKVTNRLSNGKIRNEDDRYIYQNASTNNGYDRTRKKDITSSRFEYNNNNSNNNDNVYRREMTNYAPSRSSERYQHRGNSNNSNSNQTSSIVHGGLVHSADEHHYQQQQQHNSRSNESSPLWYNSTTLTTTSNINTTFSNSTPIPSSSSHYRLSSTSSPSISQPPPPTLTNNNINSSSSTSHIETIRRSSQQSSPSIPFNSSLSATGGNNNTTTTTNNNNPPIMMGRPLTAFLRDTSTSSEHIHHQHQHSKENNISRSFPFPTSNNNERHNTLL